MRLPALICAALTAVVSWAATPLDDARARLDELPLHPVEGLWSLPGDDAVIEIVRDSLTTSGTVASYRMAIVEHPALFMPAGTVIGHITPTAAYCKFDASICTDLFPGPTLLPVSPRKYTLSLSDDESIITATRYGRNVVVRWWRLLPYMLRWAFAVENTRSNLPAGLQRIYPAPATPLTPAYL